MNHFYVYAHARASDGKVFYIGKGRGNRAFSKDGRNKYWARVVDKHGLNVRLIKSDMSEPCAFSLERAMIAALGRKNLCNLTDGGEGPSGYILTDHQRAKYLEARGRPVATRCGLSFPTSTDAAKWVNPENTHAAKVMISQAAKGQRKRAYGYEWGFIQDCQPVFVASSPYQGNGGKVPIACNNGMRFASVRDAARWAKSVGYERATGRCISRVATWGGHVYGYEWGYIKDGQPVFLGRKPIRPRRLKSCAVDTL
jgi:hypothetical protein